MELFDKDPDQDDLLGRWESQLDPTLWGQSPWGGIEVTAPWLGVLGSQPPYGNIRITAPIWDIEVTAPIWEHWGHSPQGGHWGHSPELTADPPPPLPSPQDEAGFWGGAEGAGSGGGEEGAVVLGSGSGVEGKGWGCADPTVPTVVPTAGWRPGAAAHALGVADVAA